MLGLLVLPWGSVRLAAAPVGSQTASRAVAGVGTSGADSAAAVEAARDAQGRFERERLRLIPRDRWGFSGGSCDERVGRMCLRLEGGSDWWWPASEAPELTASRTRLLETLDAAAAAAPGDPWLLGQRVVYLGEAGRWDDALAAARRCGPSEPWWCSALEGLVLHVTGRYTESQRAFDRALSTMPPEQARRWRDVEPLLDGDGLGARKRAMERGDPAATERFWRLSDPLFLVPGNDRRTEHLARHTWAVTREGARNPYAMSWGWDLEELLVRYGWEVGWERREPGMATVGPSASAVGHQDPRSQGFVAPAAVWDASPESDAEDWNPGSRRQPRTGYAPAYAPTFLALDAGVHLLPRGDSVLVVVRVPGVPEDTTFHAAHDHPPPPDATDFAAGDPVHGLFAASLDGGGLLGVTAPGREGTLVLAVPPGDHVVSVEVWDPGARTAGRSRRGLRLEAVPRDVATLSDLLLARARGPIPDELSGLLPHLVDDVVFQPGDTIRVGWEVHGVGWRPESLAYELALREEGGGVWSRLGRALGVGGERRGIGLDWTEAGPARPGPVFRAVDLVLPPDMAEGAFRLRLHLASEGRGTLVAERRVEVREAPARR